MTEFGAGQVIYELRREIQKLTSELKTLDISQPKQPELIESTNLLRSNKHLTEVNSKSSELIAFYKEYSKELEKMLTTVFEIQKDLKEILKAQSLLISEPKKTKKSTTKKKSKK